MSGILETIDADLIEPRRLAASAIDQLKVERRKPPANGRRGITAREALKVLAFESQLVALCAENQAQGIVLTDADRTRLMVALARITTIIAEANQ